MKQKILICGGNGFIGRNLINHFSQNKNYEVRATWHKNTSVTEENIPNVKLIDTSYLSAHYILKYKQIMFTKTSAKEIEKRLLNYE